MAAVALAACGDDADDAADGKPLNRVQYQAQIDRAGTYVGLAAEFYRDTTGEKPQWRCDLKMGGFRYAAEKLREHLEAQPAPPADMADTHRKFVDAATETIDQIDDLAEEVASGEVACGEAVERRLKGMASIARMGEAVDDLRSQGYVIVDERALGVH